MDISEKRPPKREVTQMVPQAVKGEPGLVLVDTTWGINILRQSRRYYDCWPLKGA